MDLREQMMMEVVMDLREDPERAGAACATAAGMACGELICVRTIDVRWVGNVPMEELPEGMCHVWHEAFGYGADGKFAGKHESGCGEDSLLTGPSDRIESIAVVGHVGSFDGPLAVFEL